MLKVNTFEPASIVEFILEGDSDRYEVPELIRNQYGNISKSVLWNITCGSNAESLR